MAQMYGRLQSIKKRALAKRQLKILETLLNRDSPINLDDLLRDVRKDYAKLAAITKAFVRDINHLVKLRAIEVKTERAIPGRGPFSQYTVSARSQYTVSARLEWPMEITETKFYEEINKMPRAKTRLMLG